MVQGELGDGGMLDLGRGKVRLEDGAERQYVAGRAGGERTPGGGGLEGGTRLWESVVRGEGVE